MPFSLPFDKLRTNGSMVLLIVSVRPEGTRVFALYERKNRNTKEDTVPLCRRLDRRLRKSYLSPVIDHPSTMHIERYWLWSSCSHVSESDRVYATNTFGKGETAMHAAVSLLLNAFRADSLRDDRPTSAAVCSTNILSTVLNDLPLDDLARQALLALREPLRTGSQAATLAVIFDCARTIDARMADPATVERVQASARCLEMALAINHLTDRESQDRVALQLESLDLFRYIDTLQIAGDAGSPDIILVGAPALASSSAITIRLPLQGYLAQRVIIDYQNRSSYPHIRLTTPTRIARDDRSRSRSVWVQKPAPAYDLNVYTYKDRLMGRIQTRAIEPLSQIAGQRLTLTFARQNDTQLLATDVFDEQGVLRVQFIRRTPAPVVAA
jgi:hypothetical protein